MRDKTAKEANEKLDKYYGTSVPSNTTVKRWMQEFKFGRTSTNNEPRSGGPSDAIAPEIIKTIQRLMTNDRNLKVRKIIRW